MKKIRWKQRSEMVRHGGPKFFKFHFTDSKLAHNLLIVIKSIPCKGISFKFDFEAKREKKDAAFLSI